MLEEAYGEAAMKKMQVYGWHKHFCDGRARVNDDLRSGRPSTSRNDKNIDRVRNVVRSDRRKSIQQISAEVGISVGSVHGILHEDLNMHYVCQHLVPKMPTPEHKETRMTLAGDLITMADQDVDFFNNIITGDET